MNIKSTFLVTSRNMSSFAKSIYQKNMFHLPFNKPAELIFHSETVFCLFEATDNNDE